MMSTGPSAGLLRIEKGMGIILRPEKPRCEVARIVERAWRFTSAKATGFAES
jgi:hypothetical protein